MLYTGERRPTWGVIVRVLIVEDEAEFANTLRIALERERFVVDQADRISMAQEAAMQQKWIVKIRC